MNTGLLRVYQHLPVGVRSLAASMRGYYLRSWRYGRDTEANVTEALARECWTAQQWAGWREQHLAWLLARAATRVPYYRELWARRRGAGDRASHEVLANWPVLRKEELRANPAAFIADDRTRGSMFREHTSGTTGKPLQLWFSRSTLRMWYALYEARARRWCGVSYRDRWANIGGQQVAAFDQMAPPFWIWNAAMRQLYLSSYHLAKQFIRAYIDAMRAYRLVFALGYSSSLYSLAHFANDLGLAPAPLRAVTTNAEPLYDFQREAIQRAFGVRPRETYGMSELACAASECEAGGLHEWPDTGIIEIFSDVADNVVQDGETGRIICTGLLNADMPLIRYEVGDRGARAPVDRACACGRTLPLLSHIEGRTDDVLITRDGRRIGRLDPVFKSNLAIREAQIIQESLDAVRIKVVPATGYSDQVARALADSLRDRMGDVDVTVDVVDSIARTANGKFRAVVNLVVQGRASGAT